MGWLSALFGPRENPIEWVAQGAQIIDVRQASEFQSGHAKGAKNIPLDQLSVKIGKAVKSKDDAIVLCCRSGARSSAARRMLKRQGYTKLLNAGPWTALKTLFLAISLSSMVACAQQPNTADQDPNSPHLSAMQFQVLASETDAVVVDIRTPGEWQGGIIEGALMINFYDADFVKKIKAIDAPYGILLYCRSGNRSGQALQILEKSGVESVRHLGGGIMAWQRAGASLVRPE